MHREASLWYPNRALTHITLTGETLSSRCVMGGGGARAIPPSKPDRGEAVKPPARGGQHGAVVPALPNAGVVPVGLPHVPGWTLAQGH